MGFGFFLFVFVSFFSFFFLALGKDKRICFQVLFELLSHSCPVSWSKKLGVLNTSQNKQCTMSGILSGQMQNLTNSHSLCPLRKGHP